MTDWLIDWIVGQQHSCLADGLAIVAILKYKIAILVLGKTLLPEFLKVQY